MRKQVEYTFMIGYPEKHETYESRIISAASFLCGGCTVFDAKGYWVEGADRIARMFPGWCESEHVLVLSVTTELDKRDIVYNKMKSIITHETALYGIDTTWVHVQTKDILGMHFNVKE